MADLRPSSMLQFIMFACYSPYAYLQGVSGFPANVEVVGGIE